MPSHHLKSLGRFAERLAAKHLNSIGYDVIEHNLQHIGLEWDLVALKQGVLYLIEVKYRAKLPRPGELEGIFLSAAKRRLTANSLGSAPLGERLTAAVQSRNLVTQTLNINFILVTGNRVKQAWQSKQNINLMDCEIEIFENQIERFRIPFS